MYSNFLYPHETLLFPVVVPSFHLTIQSWIRQFDSMRPLQIYRYNEAMTVNIIGLLPPTHSLACAACFIISKGCTTGRPTYGITRDAPTIRLVLVRPKHDSKDKCRNSNWNETFFVVRSSF
eukprot:scaffold19705_cov58-Attheya_sp.AAC.3